MQFEGIRTALCHRGNMYWKAVRG